MRRPRPSRRCSASPACRRRKAGWQRSRVMALFDERGAAQRGRRRCCWRRTSSRGCQLRGVAEVPEQDWVRLTQSQFAPVEITPELLDRADLARAAGRGAAGDPARPGPGLRHRHASDHAHVPALDRRPGAARRRRWTRVLDYGCGSGILAIGAAHVRRARRSMRSTSTGGGRVDAGQCRRPTASQLRAGLPDLADGALPDWCWPTSWPRRSSCWRRCCAATSRPAAQLVLAGILERQADELKAAYAPYAAAGGQRQRGRLDPDDRAGGCRPRRLRPAAVAR